MDDNSGGSGRDALAGYDYQMDVSVWLSLLLVVGNKQAQELTLEPASQEDVEGTLDEFEPEGLRERSGWDIPNSSSRPSYEAAMRGPSRRFKRCWNMAAISDLLRLNA